MSGYLTVDGIVLRAVDFGESSRMLTVFTGEYGLISVRARGVRRAKSKLSACTQPFCYSRFELCKKQGEVYTLTGGTVLEAFYGLSGDLEAFYTAGYMGKLLLRILQPDLPDPETLRLLLNSLYFLATGKREHRYVKCVFLLKLACIQGVMPTSLGVLQPDTQKALAHIQNSTLETLFQFGVSAIILEELERISVQVEREFI